MRPQFIFIGPHKSGTTWIDNYLRTRSDVVLPQLTKETFFLDKYYDRGMTWYEQQFGPPRTDAVCVEVAPSLLAKPMAALRVARELPGTIVICTLREPIERAIAHYFHYLKGGEPDMGFCNMVTKYPEILEIGFYYEHLSRWADLLGRERVRLLNYDTLCADPDEYCAQICRLLGIPVEIPEPDTLHARVNEDGFPEHRLLAKLARRSAEELRKAGAHRIVNFVRTPGVRRLIYGAPPSASKRAQISAQAWKYADLFRNDIERLTADFGADVSSWKRSLQEPVGM